MIKEYGIIREAAKRVAEAANGTVDTLNNGRIEQEPAYTDRMLGRIEQAMNEFQTKGIRWTAKTLTDHGRGSQEKEYGADFVGVLEINLRAFAVKKGFLAQAKLLKPGKDITRSEWDRMKDQCETMLQVSPASFVFVYARSGTIVVPAATIVSLSEPEAPHELYSRKTFKVLRGAFRVFHWGPRDPFPFYPSA